MRELPPGAATMNSGWSFQLEICEPGGRWRVLHRYVGWGAACRAFSIALASGARGVRIVDREGRQIEAYWPGRERAA